MSEGGPPARRATCALALAAALLAGPPAAAAASSAQGLSAQLAQLQQEVSAGQSRLAAAQATAAAAERRAGIATGQVQQQTAYIAGLQAQIAAAQRQAAAGAAALSAADARLALDRRRADAGLGLLYEAGSGRFLGVLLGAENWSAFLTRFHDLQALFSSEVDALRQEQAAQAAAAAREQALRVQETSLQGLVAEAAASLQQLSTAAQIAGSAANAAQAQQAQEAEAVAAESAAAARVTALLASQQPVAPGPVRGQIAFAWPLPAPHLLTAPFGPRVNPITHLSEIHTGVDIADPVGTPIHAAAAGVVVFAGWQTGYGMVIILDHGRVGAHTYYTLYAHQSKFAVALHQRVQQGQVIGYIGLTGWTTGPHLHFEIRVDGQPVNPVPFLPQTGIRIYY